MEKQAVSVGRVVEWPGALDLQCVEPVLNAAVFRDVDLGGLVVRLGGVGLRLKWNMF